MNKLTIQLIKKLWGVDLEQLKADNQELVSANERMRVQNEQSAANIAHLTQVATQLENQMQQDKEISRTELEQQKNIIHQQQMELNRMEEEARSLRFHMETEIEQKATTILQLEIAEKEAKAETVAAKAEAEKAKAEAENAKAETVAAKAEAEKAKAEAENAKAETVAAKAEAEKAKAEAENAKAETEAAKAEAEKAKSEAENAKAKTVAAKAETEIAKTEAENAKAETIAAKAEAEKAKAEAENAKAETEAAKAEAEKEKAEAENAKAETVAAKAEAEKAKAEAEKAKATTEQLTTTNNDLIHQLSAVEALCQQQTHTIQQLQTRIKELEDKHAALQTKVETTVAAKQEINAGPHVVPIQRESSQTPTASDAKASEEQSCQTGKKTTTENKSCTAKENILEAYQEMKAKLEESTLKYPFTRITTVTNGNQYLYYSRTLGLKAELFVWGIEGREVVLDEPHFIPYNEIADIEGLNTPFATEPMNCDFSDEGNATEVAETLLTAICRYQPVHVTYRDKNGRISDRNLYWISFLPENKQPVGLPNPHLFEDMFADNIDTDYLLAMCAHYAEPRIFIINQILSLQVYNVFATNRLGIEAQLNGYQAALECGQEEAAEMIYYCLPEQFRSQLRSH